MPILNRLTQLFRADLHGVLDRVEQPDLLLRQSLREMDDALADARRRLERDRRSREALGRRQQEIATTLAASSDELDLCLDAGNDDLARVLLRRRLEGERLLAHLARQSARLDAAIEQAQRALLEQQAQFDLLRQQAEAQVPAGDDASTAAAPSWSAEQFAVSDADVELALLREQRRRA